MMRGIVGKPRMKYGLLLESNGTVKVLNRRGSNIRYRAARAVSISEQSSDRRMFSGLTARRPRLVFLDQPGVWCVLP